VLLKHGGVQICGQWCYQSTISFKEFLAVSSAQLCSIYWETRHANVYFFVFVVTVPTALNPKHFINYTAFSSGLLWSITTIVTRQFKECF